MMNKIMVTVYCTAYNHEKYIKDALEGFISQKTNFPFEVLVHDDASTDKTPSIIRDYERKYPSIIKGIYQKENIYSRGINRTYEYMLPETHGKYIAFCEGDDYWCDPNKLQSQYDYMENHPECSLVVHKALKQYSNGKKVQYTNWQFRDNCCLTAEQIIDDLALFPLNSMFFHTDFFRKNESFLKQHQTFDYLLKIMLAIEGTVYVIPKTMSVYRICSVGSWTERVGNNNKKLIEHEGIAIRSLNDLDQYTNFQYHSNLNSNIIRRKYHVEELKGNYHELKNEPYISIYRKQSVKYRILVKIKGKCPLFYRRIRAIYNIIYHKK